MHRYITQILQSNHLCFFRYRHEIVYINNKIILLGGGTSDSVCPMVNIPMYDVKTNKWMNRTSLPDMSVKPGEYNIKPPLYLRR